MKIVTVDIPSVGLSPEKLPFAPGHTSWLVYEGGVFLKAFNSPNGAQIFIDGLSLRRFRDK